MAGKVQSAAKKDEGRIDKELVCQGIHELAQVGDQVPASCDMSVHGIRDGADDKKNTADQVNPVEAEMEACQDKFFGKGLACSRDVGEGEDGDNQKSHHQSYRRDLVWCIHTFFLFRVPTL